ncbi:Uncharacterised protein [Actinobacillus equuli]|nr:Uncharacterised protein [Actinobacillus equuli]
MNIRWILIICLVLLLVLAHQLYNNLSTNYTAGICLPCSYYKSSCLNFQPLNFIKF